MEPTMSIADKDFDDFLTARGEPPFESFFENGLALDFGLHSSSFEPSITYASPDAASFDALRTDSSASLGKAEYSVPPALDLVLRPAQATHSVASPQFEVPRSRKLVHQLRPNGLGISGPELLSLEGRSQSTLVASTATSTGTANPFATAYPVPEHSTPPITPNPQRIRQRTSTSPIRKQAFTSKRSKSQSAKAAAVAAAATMATPCPTMRTYSPNVGHSREPVPPIDLSHHTLNYPPSPPPSGQFAPHFPFAMPPNDTLTSSHSVRTSPMFHRYADLMDSASYRPSYVTPTTACTQVPGLPPGWSNSNLHCHGSYLSSPAWDAALSTPILDSDTPCFDAGSFEDVEFDNSYLPDANLTGAGIMIYPGNCENDGFAQDQGSFNSYQPHTSTRSPRESTPPASPKLRAPGSYANAASQPPPEIIVPKRGSTGSNSSTQKRARGATQHTDEPSRSTGSSGVGRKVANAHGGSGSGSGSGNTQNSQPSSGRRAGGHHASHSLSNMSKHAARSVRAHKSTGSLVSAQKSSGSSFSVNAHALSNKTSLGSISSASGVANSMSFVNYTEKDSSKILSGVAPSGSSKTKARREREANEKQRRMSAALAMAMRGNVGALEGMLE